MYVRTLLLLLTLSLSLNSNASLIKLSINGDVNFAGAKISGVEAPIGSKFYLDLVLEGENPESYPLSNTVFYNVNKLSFSKVDGTFNVPITEEFKVIVSETQMYSSFSSQSPITHSFVLDISFLNSINPLSPESWQSPSVNGYTYYRDTDYENGIRRDKSINHLAGYDPFDLFGDKLSVSATQNISISEPPSIILLTFVLVILAQFRRT